MTIDPAEAANGGYEEIKLYNLAMEYRDCYKWGCNEYQYVYAQWRDGKLSTGEYQSMVAAVGASIGRQLTNIDRTGYRYPNTHPRI